VLEFDEFMRIEGCQQKERHLFIGTVKRGGAEEAVSDVRLDFYQTSTSIIASLYLKRIDKSKASITFPSPTSIELDLITADSTRYRKVVPLFGPIDPAKSTYKIMGTKLELTLLKADGRSWPTLRSDDDRVSGIFQVGPSKRM
jgi:hypothetical protein